MLRRALKRSVNKREEKSVIAKDESTQKQSRKEILGDKQKDETERVLESLVLGGDEDIVKSLNQQTQKFQEEKKTKHGRRQPGFDLTGEHRKPAWEDDDDLVERIEVKVSKTHGLCRKEKKDLSKKEYTRQLKAQFEKVSAPPNWATLPSEKKREASEDGDSDVEELLHKTGSYLAESLTLPKGFLQIKQCTDANKETSSKSKLQSVEFHPTAQVLLTGGLDQTLNLFQVDGKNNPKIQSVFVDNFPMHCCHFSTDGEEVIMGSKHKSFYYYDMIAGKIVNVPWIKGLEENHMKYFEVSPDGRFLAFLGKYGAIHLLSAKSKEWIQTLKMNGTVMSVAFSKDSTRMFSFGNDGMVYVWDMNTRDCVHRFYDEGCIKGTTLSVSPNNQYIACGCYSGVVNVYDMETCLAKQDPKPLRAFMNLTTPCTDTKFNSTSEILAIASNFSEKTVKLVHFPSMTVFSNFPDGHETNFQVPLSLDFSLNSGYFTVGTNKGHALLFRLKHYGNY
ncbi:hypothetical protein ACJMK2_032854 [Sinanodonta woodiana]|uniref:U3 small nucleolar RNA-associated protein 18 homolog n=1 Tax=Sinanodonta woodiana TaxID=1069815 RepID=A0ABD3X6X8_SINWO